MPRSSMIQPSVCLQSFTYADLKDGGLVTVPNSNPWLDTSYSTCSGTSQAVQEYSSLYGLSGVVQGSASTGQQFCGLVGWHADYAATDGDKCYWGTPSTNILGCAVSINPSVRADSTHTLVWPYISLNAKVNVLSDTSSGVCNAFSSSVCEDVYVDFWIHWTKPVGPNSLQDMEFMVQLESSRCASICPLDYYNAGTSYQYFHRVGPVSLSTWKSFSFSETDFASILGSALCGPSPVGFCTWNLPYADGWITGFDYGQEIGGNNISASAALDSIGLFACPAGNYPGNLGYIAKCQ